MVKNEKKVKNIKVKQKRGEKKKMKKEEKLTGAKQIEIVVEALLRLVKGAKSSESISEYVYDENGEKRLKSCKTTVKVANPDVESIKILLSLKNEKDFSKMSDEELEVEKDRLFELINDLKNK